MLRIALSMTMATLLVTAAHAQTVIDQPSTVPGQVPQQRQPGQNQNQPGRADDATQNNQLQQVTAACLLLGNNEEVAIAEFAQQKAESDKVKEFAAMLVDDHRAAAQKLQRFAPSMAGMDLGLEASNNRNADNDNARNTNSATISQPSRQANNQPGTNRSTLTQPSTAGGSPYAQIIAMQHTAHEECLKLTKEELSSKEGAKFDMCFVGQQIGSHIGMLAKLEAAEQHSDGELQQVVSEMKSKVKQHLDEAKQLAKDLESDYEKNRSDNEQRSST